MYTYISIDCMLCVVTIRIMLCLFTILYSNIMHSYNILHHISYNILNHMFTLLQYFLMILKHKAFYIMNYNV